MNFRLCPVSDLLNGIQYELLQGDLDIAVNRLTHNSRDVEKASMFFAIEGIRSDGHNYVEKAIEQGATVVALQKLPEELKKGITYIRFDNSRKALGEMLSAYYEFPSEALNLVGVTGTNGKTSIATLLYDLFTQIGYKCGLISTVENMVVQEKVPASHTTPDPTKLHLLIYKMKEAGVDFCFMEISSHSQSQYRTAGLKFRMGIFTNLTHDHLDYHGSFRNYLQAKKTFFDNLPNDAVAISNLDDKNGVVMLQNTKAKKCFYSLWSDADYKGQILSNEILGLHMKINNVEFHSQLVGRFNAFNLLAIYAAGVELLQENIEILRGMSLLNPVVGRFETIQSKQKNLIGIVDYAHTPDALKNVLDTISEVKNKGGRTITVVGCGGDRDRTKRPLMANIAYERSDIVILTSDNPRTEDPDEILEEMEEGVPKPYIKVCMRIEDRRVAIKTAVNLAQANDIILIAGKGHETYQEINGIKYPFDDREELKAAFHHDI